MNHAVPTRLGLCRRAHYASLLSRAHRLAGRSVISMAEVTGKLYIVHLLCITVGSILSWPRSFFDFFGSFCAKWILGDCVVDPVNESTMI